MAKKTKFPEKLAKYLDKAGVGHKILEHKTVYTAFDAASTMKKKLDEIAKSLLVMADKNYYLVILPAGYNLDFKKLGKLIGKEIGKPVKAVKIPSEKVMVNALKIKTGAVTAFGGVYKLPVIVESKLAKAKNAIFSSGSFNHSIEMAVKDFAKLENAVMGEFGIKKKIKLQKIKVAKKVAKKKVVKKKSARSK
jgi:Ala-tRNA(Pro) deacylase